MASYTPATAVAAGDKEEAACLQAFELMCAFTVPMTLKAAIELGLVDELLAAAAAGVTAEELAARLRLPAAAAAAAVDRMLRLLASYGVVRCATEAGPDGKARRSYAAAPVCKWLAGGSSGGEESMAPLGLLNLDKVFMENWYVRKYNTYVAYILRMFLNIYIHIQYVPKYLTPLTFF